MRIALPCIDVETRLKWVPVVRPRTMPRLPLPRSMKTAFPLGQGGTSGGFRNGLSGRPCQTGHDNPLKASRPLSFRLLSPLVRGIFKGV